MNTLSLAKSLPKYLAVIFSAVIISGVTLITSSLIHADAKASTSHSEQVSETDVRADEPEESENTTYETGSAVDDPNDTSEDTEVSQATSSDSTSQMKVSDSNTDSNNSQTSVDAPVSQTNSNVQNQTSPSNNDDEQQVIQTDNASTSSTESTTDAASGSGEKDKDADPAKLGNLLGGGENGDGDEEGIYQPDKDLLDLTDYYRQG